MSRVMLPHDPADPQECGRAGELVTGVTVTSGLLLRANGSQMNVTQAARAHRTRVKNRLKQLGFLAGRNVMNAYAKAGRVFEPFSRVDVLYVIHYPPRAHDMDADNLFPTVKPLTDGLTLAGIWPDDSARYLRRRTYLASRYRSRTGEWDIDIHIKPLTDADEEDL